MIIGGRPHNIRYVTGIVAGFTAIFLAVSAYIAIFPMAFLPNGYPVWIAKKRMLDACDLGQVVLFGDSQLEAGIVAHGLPLVSTNFSAGGVSPLDSYFLVRQAVACPDFPKHAIVSFAFADFIQIQPAFWANTIRYGILGTAAIADIEETARRLRDPSFHDYVTFEGLSGWSRNFLYAHHFAPLYFDSLVRGGFFLREYSNRATFVQALARRGQMPYGGVQAPGPTDRYNRPPAPGFHPLPIQSEFFERLVTALEKAGTSIDFILMPTSYANAPQLLVANLEPDFIAYLQEVERRHPKFRLSQSGVPIWPDRYFVDNVHLNPDGAARFTTRLNDCLRFADADSRTGAYSRSCDLANGAPDAASINTQ